jgi:hypothetical protein
MERIRWTSLCVLLAALFAPGCQSTDSNTAKGTITGGLLGAGMGTIIGGASGNPAAGAALGAGVGALSGAAIGSSIDEAEARNRALIEAQLGRQIAPGAVSVGEVISMTQARVNEDLIITHIRKHGMAATPTANDLILMKQSGVATRVMQMMQNTPVATVVPTKTIVVREEPAVVVYGESCPPPPHHPHPW